MSITVRFACGHAGTVAVTSDIAPTCPICGVGQIRHVTARAPRFRGTCAGPYAETVDLPAIPMCLAPKGPLVITDAEE